MYLSFLYMLKKWMTCITWFNASNLLFPKLLGLFQELDCFDVQLQGKTAVLFFVTGPMKLSCILNSTLHEEWI